MYESEQQHIHFIVYALRMHAYTTDCACLKHSRMHSRIVHVSTLKFNVYSKRLCMQACLNTQELEYARAKFTQEQELNLRKSKNFFLTTRQNFLKAQQKK